MFKKIDEPLFKVFSILTLTLALLLLSYSGWQFYKGDFTENMISLHLWMGILVLILMPTHMIIKKNKIKKLSQEFVNTLLGKDIKHTNNKEFLLESIKSNSLKELSLIFHFDLYKIMAAIEEEKIHIKNENEKLKEVAKQNKRDIYQIFILILALHVKESSPQKG